MRKKKTKKVLDYLVLIFLTIIYLASVLLLNFNSQYTKALTIGFATAYFIWGIVHHHKEKNLHFKVVLEYLLIALLGAWLIIGIF
jgi:hypothetical protein